MSIINFITSIGKNNKFYKIFQIKQQNCCVCYEKKDKIIRCINLKCTDGVICFECFNKLDKNLKKRCLICNIERNHIKKDKKIIFCKEVLLSSLCCLISVGLSYIIGFLIYSFLTNKIKELTMSFNPVFLILIGFSVSGVIIFLCLILIFIPEVIFLF